MDTRAPQGASMDEPRRAETGLLPISVLVPLWVLALIAGVVFTLLR